MTHYAYLFEAKSIQDYLLATNRLKEIVGGSELVESLTGKRGLFDCALEAVGGVFEHSRKGGGAAFVFTTDKQARDRLAALWPLLMAKYAPVLDFVQARGEGTTPKGAFDQAQTALRTDRNRVSAKLPRAGPFAERNRRTGEVAEAHAQAKKGEDREPVDAPTYRKLAPAFRKGKDLIDRFAPGSSPDVWPVNLDPKDADDVGGRLFPFQGDDRTIALVHADGNGLGQLLMDIKDAIEGRPDTYIDTFRRFSAAVKDATERAARLATSEVPGRQIDPKDLLYPARPVVLGGDDLTMLIRADLALPFTRHFLAAFAKETETELKPLRDSLGDKLPRRLTACAGIAYARASQPFYLLHQLAEQLCKHAKKIAKGTRTDKRGEVPSALSFHRITTALIDRYDQVLTDELTARGGLRQTLECYGLDSGRGLAALDDLLALQDLLASPEMARGPTRELLGLIGNDPPQATRQYRRWRELMASGRIDPRHRDALRRFDELMRQLGVSQPDGDLPYRGTEIDGLRRSPLGDMLILQAVGNRIELAAPAQRQESAT